MMLGLCGWVLVGLLGLDESSVVGIWVFVVSSEVQIDLRTTLCLFDFEEVGASKSLRLIVVCSF